mgnify:CR=1 FL=1
MNENLIKKIFPLDKLLKNEYIKKLKYDNEGLWSISYPESAEKLSKRIKNFDSEDFKIRNILDATAGIGGNTISFSNFFDCVFAVELDKLRFNYLENNVGLFVNSNKIKLYNQNSLDFINLHRLYSRESCLIQHAYRSYCHSRYFRRSYQLIMSYFAAMLLDFGEPVGLLPPEK